MFLCFKIAGIWSKTRRGKNNAKTKASQLNVSSSDSMLCILSYAWTVEYMKRDIAKVILLNNQKEKKNLQPESSENISRKLWTSWTIGWKPKNITKYFFHPPPFQNLFDYCNNFNEAFLKVSPHFPLSFFIFLDNVYIDQSIFQFVGLQGWTGAKLGMGTL